MGGKNFFKIKLRTGKLVKEVGQDATLADFKGRRLCMDAAWLINNGMRATANPDEFITDASGQITSHLLSTLNRVLQYRNAGIEQLWLFDNPVANPLKAVENAKRKAKRDEAEEAGDARGAFSVTSPQYDEVKQLLGLLGVAYAEAPPGIEAEQYGAFLTTGAEPFCDAMISGDSDVLLCGGNLLRLQKGKFTLFKLDEICVEGGVTRDELLRAAVALGTDFNTKIANIGDVTAIEKARVATFTEQQQTAYDYFRKPLHKVSIEIHESVLDVDATLDYLISKGFKRDYWHGRIIPKAVGRKAAARTRAVKTAADAAKLEVGE